MPDRIRIDEARVTFFRRLICKDDNPDGVFPYFYQALTFAACLGHHLGESLPVKNPAKSPDPVALEIFSGNNLEYVIELLALATVNDPRVLGGDQSQVEKRCEIFESYANAGLASLEKQCIGDKSPVMVIQDVLAQIHQAHMETGEPPNLSSLISG